MICADIKEQVDAQKEEIAELTNSREKKNDRLVNGAAFARENDMNCYASRSFPRGQKARLMM